VFGPNILDNPGPSWYSESMKIIVNSLIVIFFIAVVAPSFYIFFDNLNTHVIKGEMPFKDFAARTREYSYQPVLDFYVDKFNQVKAAESQKETQPQ
jgi:hypothetical protein